MSKSPSAMKKSSSVKAIKSKRNFNEEEMKIIGRWLEEVVGENLDLNDLLLSLRSGIKLCRLINRLQPGILDESRLSTESSSLAFEENIKAYLAACFQLGVRAHELFTAEDVLNNGDVQSVLRNIVAVNKACVARGYSGPKLNISEHDENELERVWTEIVSLQKALKSVLEENTTLRRENKEIKDHVGKQDSELSKLKQKIQAIERAQHEAAEKSPRGATSDGEGGVTSDSEAPAIVYVIKKKPKSRSSKSTSNIYDEDGQPRESSAVIELHERSSSGSIPSPGREASLVLVDEGRKKSSKKRAPQRKNALGNAKTDDALFQSLSMLAF